jgi:hypothetical protein
MTDAELEEGITVVRRQMEDDPRGQRTQITLKRFLEEQENRQYETAAVRASRFRRRIAWEANQERKEKLENRLAKRVV